MAQIYELSYLTKLHKERKALNGVIYRTSDRYFKGNTDGRLDEVTDLTINNITNNNVTTIEADLTEVEGRVTNLETSKADKCFTIAMSIIL